MNKNTLVFSKARATGSKTFFIICAIMTTSKILIKGITCRYTSLKKKCIMYFRLNDRNIADIDQKNKAPEFANYSWGKMFDFASRGGRYGRLEPITVWTSLIGQAFLDIFQVPEF